MGHVEQRSTHRELVTTHAQLQLQLHLAAHIFTRISPFMHALTHPLSTDRLTPTILSTGNGNAFFSASAATSLVLIAN
eukprot:m.351049 g.351049  ORF g.351049 m.351049 type:complete len:78 (+) comp16161_c1_seq13:1691-1924(+)